MKLPGTPDFLMPEPQSLLDQMWAGAAQAMQPPLSRPSALVGECLDDRHPVAEGRFLIAYPNIDGGPQERWLASLQGLRVGTGDRVVLLRPGNWPEPVIVGVLCGVADEREPRMRFGPTVRLEEHDSLRITGADGTPLVEISQAESGPAIRLLQHDVEIHSPGNLCISAKALELQARDDMAVHDDMIRLN